MATTVDDVIARVVLLASDVTGITGAIDDWPSLPVEDAGLPLIVVEEDQSSYTEVLSGEEWQQRISLFLTILVQRALTNTNNFDAAGRALVRPHIDNVVMHFMERPTLRRGSDSGLAFVRTTTDIQSSRPAISPTVGNTLYAAAQVRISVILDKIKE
jgi:hypothetical protein